MRGKKIAISGATGFIGCRLVDAVCKQGASVVALTRDPLKVKSLWTQGLVRGACVDLSTGEGLEAACRGADTVFHLAGYTHASGQDRMEAGRRHEETTVTGTRALLAAAESSGVRTFVFISSVKAIGEGGKACFDETSATIPTSHYGRAKLVAEHLVLEQGRRNGMHVVVLRLPLVYGPGNKGNIPRMIAAIDRGRFPSLPNTHNKRSMVHVNDVVRATLLAEENLAANGQVFLVTDGRIYSTRELYEAICQALGRPVPGWSVPVWFLRSAARLGDALQGALGRTMPLTTDSLDKLLGSAEYSNEKIRTQLGFEPKYSFYDALPEMIHEYRNTAAALTSHRGQ